MCCAQTRFDQNVFSFFHRRKKKAELLLNAAVKLSFSRILQKWRIWRFQVFSVCNCGWKEVQVEETSTVVGSLQVTSHMHPWFLLFAFKGFIFLPHPTSLSCYILTRHPTLSGQLISWLHPEPGGNKLSSVVSGERVARKQVTLFDRAEVGGLFLPIQRLSEV